MKLKTWESVLAGTLFVVLLLASLLSFMPFDIFNEVNKHDENILTESVLTNTISEQDNSEIAAAGELTTAVKKEIITSKMPTKKHLMLSDIDPDNCIPLDKITLKEQKIVCDYIINEFETRGFKDVVVIEYVRDEEYNGSCYHFVWDGNYYTCIYVEDGKSKPLMLYDTELTEQMLEYWDYI